MLGHRIFPVPFSVKANETSASTCYDLPCFLLQLQWCPVMFGTPGCKTSYAGMVKQAAWKASTPFAFVAFVRPILGIHFGNMPLNMG